MTDNEKLARWQEHYVTPAGYIMNDGQLGYPMPDYPNDDAAAMSLLDTLVEKGYVPQLAYNGTTLLWQCAIDEWTMVGTHRVHSPLINDVELGRTTRREAVVAACLEVARKELEG